MGLLNYVIDSCYAKRQYHCHEVTKKNNPFINGPYKMKLSLESLCVLVPCAKGIPLGVVRFLNFA
jgi:hypothetical protein